MLGKKKNFMLNLLERQRNIQTSKNGNGYGERS